MNSPIPIEVLKDDTAVIQRFADDLMSEYLGAMKAGRQKVVFIIPVYLVGQYDLWAERCNLENVGLHDLVLINMDEYLTGDGSIGELLYGLVNLVSPSLSTRIERVAL